MLILFKDDASSFATAVEKLNFTLVFNIGRSVVGIACAARHRAIFRSALNARIFNDIYN